MIIPKLKIYMYDIYYFRIRRCSIIYFIYSSDSLDAWECCLCLFLDPNRDDDDADRRFSDKDNVKSLDDDDEHELIGDDDKLCCCWNILLRGDTDNGTRQWLPGWFVTSNGDENWLNFCCWWSCPLNDLLMGEL